MKSEVVQPFSALLMSEADPWLERFHTTKREAGRIRCEGVFNPLQAKAWENNPVGKEDERFL